MPFFGPHNSQYDPGTVDLPANFAYPPMEQNHLKPRMLYAHYAKHGFEGHRLDNEPGWRRLIANYWGLVSQVDAAVGAILEALCASGLLEDTVIVFTSDHGDMMGSHGLLAKSVMFEEAVAVPLLMRIPGVAPRTEHHPVSQIDLVPTLLDFLDAPLPHHLEGQSLRRLIEHGEPPGQCDVFIEWNGPDCAVSEHAGDMDQAVTALGSPEELAAAVSDPIRTILTFEGWKLNYSPALGQHELFNLTDDPHELTNLHGQPGLEKLVEELRSRLRAWGRRIHDPVAAAI